MTVVCGPSGASWAVSAAAAPEAGVGAFLLADAAAAAAAAAAA
eukprot:CAMPEP_0168416338 /NCGR_PEP_ID=MMETSP0228-20121227/30689_1 /TAXON_ID=133427 /ORGANISM="Protoceratium reticulatum, Strain CCCM 535 (=CCMP 1889)" /LENGTH=42 /DNA_ID= /DNA_START= /DNA_END= /DNA_ORIENTATION=